MIRGKQKITHSRMQSFKSCRKKHEFEYEIGIRRETDSRALRMGSGGHEGLDLLKRTGDIDQAMEAIRKYYAELPEGFDQLEWDYERETVESLVAGYAWRWGNQPLEVVAVEQSFCLPLVNPATGKASTNWDAAGKIDGVVRLEDGRLVVQEHKFLSDDIGSDSDLVRRLQLDHQITYYIWAARQLGYPVESVLYDVIRKPTIKPTQVPTLDDDGRKIVVDVHGERVFNANAITPRQTADTAKGYVILSRPMTPTEWSEKLMADIGKRPEWYYQRHEIARLDSDIDEMLSEVWDIQKTIREAQQLNRWYKTVSKDSCTFCSYFGICSSRFDPAETPEGFVRLESVHPELGDA